MSLLSFIQYPELQASAMLALCRLMIIDADFWLVPC